MSTMIPSMTSSKKSRTVYNAIENDVYEARIVRFIGLGVQEQPEWKGEKKSPAFKCSIAFELIDIDATGRTYEGDSDTVGKPIDPRPSCVFKDYFLFPGAKRGGVFELCQAIDPTITEVPRDMQWFIDNLNSIVNVNVGSYESRNGTKNKIISLSPVSQRRKTQVGEARSDLVGFIPYVDSPEMMNQYSKVYKFQREMLMEAKDKQHMPYAGKDPVQSEGNGTKPENTQTREDTKYSTSHKTPESNPDVIDFDDDIPF